MLNYRRTLPSCLGPGKREEGKKKREEGRKKKKSEREGKGYVDDEEKSAREWRGRVTTREAGRRDVNESARLLPDRVQLFTALHAT